MISLKKDVVYVKGALNGAVYDFRNGKVYQINSLACDEIEKYFKDTTYSSEYITKLAQMDLLDMSFRPNVYSPYKASPNLDMVWLEITQGCNLRCLHCYEGNTHFVSKKTILLSKWIDVINQLSKLNIKRVVVIGGEPCVSPFLLPILSELCKYHIQTTLFTNATLLTPEQIAFIINHCDDISVKTSIYGHNARVHDLITSVNGSFDKLNNNIQLLLSHGVSVRAAVVIMKENQDYLKEIIEYVKQSGMKYARYDVIRNVFGGTQNKHTPTDPIIINSVKYTKPNFSITKDKFDNNYFYNSCWRGKLAITEEGNIIPCVFEREIIIGNVNESTIREILDSDALKMQWCHSFEKVKVCCECEFRFACKDCRPLGKGVSGNIYEKNPRCTYDPYTGKWSDIY